MGSPYYAPQGLRMNSYKLLKQAGIYSALSFDMALSIGIGVVIGFYVDKYFSTLPLFTIVFLSLGIIAGIRTLTLLIKKFHKER